MINVKISFVATATNSHLNLVFDLIESYKKINRVEDSELIIVFKNLTHDNEIKLTKLSLGYDIKIVIAENKSRCYRKDIGWRQAKSERIAFIDVDCTFLPNYLDIVLPNIKHPIIRGRNIYSSNEKRISKLNACYRTLCDDVFFRDELFTPNLILSRGLLEKVNGFDETRNMDQSDDYILSMRLKQIMDVNIYHLDEACLINQYEDKLKKMIRTWNGYGLGYGFRFWLNESSKKGFKNFIEFTPPIVYTKRQSIEYFMFSLLQWSITFYGYICGLVRYKK